MLPASARFHDAIGIDEPGLMRHAGATHRLGTAFTGWSADGTGWLDCFGAYGPRDQAGFHQHWLIARREGDTTPFHAYAPTAALATAGRMAAAGDDRSEEHTSDLQTLTRRSSAVSCCKQNNEWN